jgi:putative membrane protein
MIIRPRPTFLQLFFIMRGSVIPRIAPQLLGFALYAAVVVLLVRHFNIAFGATGIAPFTLLGVALSIYLGFRNNAAYDRWWEARKLWGQLVFEVRNLTRVALALVPQDTGQTRPLLMSALAFCHQLRGQLRNVDVGADVERFLGGEARLLAASGNRADAIVRGMGLRIGELRRAGRIDPMDFRILDERLATLSALQAGCERIANTPLPFAYTLLLHRAAYVFCMMLPFGLAASIGWMTPLFTVVIAYSFFGLDALSGELEDPFGMEMNDLPLDRMCRVCEISVLEALGEPTPAPMKEVDFFSS